MNNHRILKTRQTLHKTLEDFLANRVALKASVSFPQVTPNLIDLIRNRAQALLEKLDELQLLQNSFQDRTDVYAALQIADIALYGRDADIPWGHWEHGGTYKIIDLMKNSKKIIDEITPQLLRILSFDSSEDVPGMASHMARYLPREEVGAWSNDQSFSSAWPLPDPFQFGGEAPSDRFSSGGLLFGSAWFTRRGEFYEQMR